MIVIIGNIGSGKSTVARLLAEMMPGYNYVCMDNFRDEKPDKYFDIDNRIFEEEIARETTEALHRNRNIIYESTGASRFFRDRFYEMVQHDSEIFTVRLKCRPEKCLSRYEKRQETGKGHFVPIYKNAKTAKQLIDEYEKKSSWIKAHLIIDSEKNSPQEIADMIFRSYPGNDPEKHLEEIFNHFEYQKALDWVNQNVKGKTFLKEILAKGQDQYNTIKLKNLINEEYALLEKRRSERSITEAKRHHPIFPDAKRSNFDREDLEEFVQERTEELYEEIEKIKEGLTRPPSEKFKVQDEDDLADKWKPIYKEANHFFTLLHFEKDQEKRKEIAFHVLNLMDEVQKIWDARDFRKKFGQLPNFDSRGIEQLSVEQMATRIRTLRTYISKANKGILNKDRIPEWEAEMKELEMKMRN